MSFVMFNSRIEGTVNAVTFDLPIWNLRIGVEPYTGAGDIAVELFDGSFIQCFDAYRYRLDIDFPQMCGADHMVLRDMIIAMINGSFPVSFDFDLDNPATKVIGDWIIENSREVIQGIISGAIRTRPVRVSFVTQALITDPADFLTATS